MATNLAIDPDLLDRALQASGERTKKAAVTLALEEFIARREQRRESSIWPAQWTGTTPTTTRQTVPGIDRHWS